MVAVQIAVDLVNEGLIDFATALKRVGKYDLNKIVRTRLSSQSNLDLLCKGISANQGVIAGKVVLRLRKLPKRSLAVASL